MSAESRVGFFRSDFTVTVLKELKAQNEGGVDQGGEEWQDVMRDVLERGGGNQVQGKGGGPVRRH